MTIGSIVRLHGYCMHDDKTFKGKEYKIIARNYAELTVQSKNGKKFTLHVLDIDEDSDTGLKVEMVKQVPWSMPF